MKAEIHPEYFETTITCSCGEVVHTRATVENMRVEICSKCHPFFTGKQKIIDTSGRVERFNTKYKNVPRRSSKGKADPVSPEPASEAPSASEAAESPAPASQE